MSHYTITGEFISDKKNNIKEDFSISDVTNTISSYFTLDGNFFSNTSESYEYEGYPTSFDMSRYSFSRDNSTATVTVIFSEPPLSPFTKDNINVPNGSLGTMSTRDNITWTGTFTAAMGVEENFNRLTFTDAYKRSLPEPKVNFSDRTSNYTVNTIPPYPTHIGMSRYSFSRDNSTATVTVILTEPDNTFTKDNIRVLNGSIGTMSTSDGGTTWTGTFTAAMGVEDNINRLTFTDAYKRYIGNVNYSDRTRNYTVNTMPPQSQANDNNQTDNTQHGNAPPMDNNSNRDVDTYQSSNRNLDTHGETSTMIITDDRVIAELKVTDEELNSKVTELLQNINRISDGQTVYNFDSLKSNLKNESSKSFITEYNNANIPSSMTSLPLNNIYVEILKTNLQIYKNIGFNKHYDISSLNGVFSDGRIGVIRELDDIHVPIFNNNLDESILSAQQNGDVKYVIIPVISSFSSKLYLLDCKSSNLSVIELNNSNEDIWESNEGLKLRTSRMISNDGGKGIVEITDSSNTINYYSIEFSYEFGRIANDNVTFPSKKQDFNINFKGRLLNVENSGGNNPLITINDNNKKKLFRSIRNLNGVFSSDEGNSFLLLTESINGKYKLVLLFPNPIKRQTDLNRFSYDLIVSTSGLMGSIGNLENSSYKICHPSGNLSNSKGICSPLVLSLLCKMSDGKFHVLFLPLLSENLFSKNTIEGFSDVRFCVNNLCFNQDEIKTLNESLDKYSCFTSKDGLVLENGEINANSEFDYFQLWKTIKSKIKNVNRETFGRHTMYLGTDVEMIVNKSMRLGTVNDIDRDNTLTEKEKNDYKEKINNEFEELKETTVRKFLSNENLHFDRRQYTINNEILEHMKEFVETYEMVDIEKMIPVDKKLSNFESEGQSLINMSGNLVSMYQDYSGAASMIRPLKKYIQYVINDEKMDDDELMKFADILNKFTLDDSKLKENQVLYLSVIADILMSLDTITSVLNIIYRNNNPDKSLVIEKFIPFPIGIYEQFPKND